MSNGLSSYILRRPASSWFNSLPEADTQDWYISTIKFHEEFDSVTAQYKAQAEAQKAQSNTQKSTPIYTFCDEGVVNKG